MPWQHSRVRMGLLEWSYWAETHCPFQPTELTPYLVLPHNTTSLLTVAFFAIGLVMRELYLFFLGIGMSLNGMLNTLLKWAFMQAVPYGRCGMYHVYCIAADAPWVVLPGGGGEAVPANACGTPPWPAHNPAGANCGGPPLAPCAPCVTCGMPAFEAQDTAFIATSIFLYMLTWRHPHIETQHHVLLVAWLGVTAWSHSFFGFNTPGQVLVGAAVGAAAAMLWHTIIFVWLYPRFDVMLQWNLVHRLGYRDTFCQSQEPVPGDPIDIVDDA